MKRSINDDDDEIEREISHPRAQGMTMKEIEKKAGDAAHAAHAVRFFDFQRWVADHMSAWAKLEAAKGRPESELTIENCLKETAVLVEVKGRKVIDPSRSLLADFPWKRLPTGHA